MKNNIFHDASIKLAGLYLLVIVVISLIFSFWLYNISLMEIRQSVLRVPGPIQRVLLNDNPNFARELRTSQDQAVEDARDNLILQLIFMNVLIAATGSTTSYIFARKTLEPIEIAHEAQSRFTSDASHELRTPITAMRLENELALSDDKLTVSKSRAQLKSNIEELDKLLAITNGLLELARLGSSEINKSEILGTKLINAAVGRVQPILKKRNQSFTMTAASDTLINADEVTATEALVIILENASNYSPESSKISISLVETSDSTELKVIDQGPGINKHDVAHIFDRFYRADKSRTKNTTESYGIGLSIARSIMDAHSGTIKVKSTKSGSTFILSFPKKP